MVGSGEISRALIVVTKTRKRGKIGSQLCQSGSAPDSSGVCGSRSARTSPAKQRMEMSPNPRFLTPGAQQEAPLGHWRFWRFPAKLGDIWSPPRKRPYVFCLNGYPFLTAPPEDAADFAKSSLDCGPAHPFNPEESDHGHQPMHCRESFQKPFLRSQANLWIIPRTGTGLSSKNANSRENPDGKHRAALALCVSTEHCLASCPILHKKFWHGIMLQIKHPADSPPHVQSQGAGVLYILPECFKDPGVT